MLIGPEASFQLRGEARFAICVVPANPRSQAMPAGYRREALPTEKTTPLGWFFYLIARPLDTIPAPAHGFFLRRMSPVASSAFPGATQDLNHIGETLLSRCICIPEHAQSEGGKR
jgi:hypothetical protein